MRLSFRTYVDRLLWIRKYPVYTEAPVQHASRALAFTWAEQQAMPRDFEFTACGGARFLSPPNNISSFIAATFDERDCNIVRFWRQALRPGAVVIDVGANIGLYTVPASQAVGAGGRVIAFEAHPQTFGYLQRNVRRNVAAGVVAENLAVGAAPGTVTMTFQAGNPGETHVATDGEAGDVAVRMVTLDDYCRATGVATIDYMKIDVEGYETNVLRGAASIVAASDRVLIQTEYEPRHMSRYGGAMDMAALLAGWGFRPFRIDWTDGRPQPIAALKAHVGEIVWSRRDIAADHRLAA